MRNITRIKSNWVSKLLLYSILFITTIVLIFPLYWMIVTAFTQNGAMLSTTSVIPNISAFTLDNFKAVLKGDIFIWFRNSILTTILSTAAGLLVTIPAAYSMSRFKYRLNDAMGILLLVVRMLPATLLVVPLYYMFANVGLIDNHISLILTNIVTIIPFSVWMLKGYFDSISVSVDEAALIDGCSQLQAATRVVLPLTKPGLVATTTYAVILAWGEYLFARVFIASPNKWTITVGVSNYVNEYSILWGQIMAAAAISIIPIILLFSVLNKYLIAGLTQGAVKG